MHHLELSLTSTCTDSETRRDKRTRGKNKTKALSLHSTAHLSPHTILDYYILHRIKGKKKKSLSHPSLECMTVGSNLPDQILNPLWGTLLTRVLKQVGCDGEVEGALQPAEERETPRPTARMSLWSSAGSTPSDRTRTSVSPCVSFTNHRDSQRSRGATLNTTCIIRSAVRRVLQGENSKSKRVRIRRVQRSRDPTNTPD